MMGDFLSKRKQDQLAQSEVRQHILKVRLSKHELSVLDTVRGRLSRAETIRFLLLLKMPPPVPSINQDAWTELARAASNLNQIAHQLNCGEAVDIDLVSNELRAFRSLLVGARR